MTRNARTLPATPTLPRRSPVPNSVFASIRAPTIAGMDRRDLLRATAAMGLLAAAGLPLVGCGGGSSRVAGDAQAAAPVPAAPSPTGVPRAKSQLYRRGEGDVALTEPVPTRTARPAAGRATTEPTARPAAPAEPKDEPVAPSKADGLSTARRRGTSSSAVARTNEIPVGGGTVYPRQKLVVTQPTRGEYRAFDATCTHQGCLVAHCRDGAINCPCHDSRFSLEDGSVVEGPAKKPLTEKPIEILDGEIHAK